MLKVSKQGEDEMLIKIYPKVSNLLNMSSYVKQECQKCFTKSYYATMWDTEITSK